MTVEEYVLLYSVLPKNGTHTMLEHLQHMAIEVAGECINTVVDEQSQEVAVTASDVNVAIEVKDDVITLVNDSEVVITVSESEIGVD